MLPKVRAILLKLLPFDVLVTLMNFPGRVEKYWPEVVTFICNGPPFIADTLFVGVSAAAPANASVVVAPLTVCETETFVFRAPVPFAEYTRVKVQVPRLGTV